MWSSGNLEAFLQSAGKRPKFAGILVSTTNGNETRAAKVTFHSNKDCDEVIEQLDDCIVANSHRLRFRPWIGQSRKTLESETSKKIEAMEAQLREASNEVTGLRRQIAILTEEGQKQTAQRLQQQRQLQAQQDELSALKRRASAQPAASAMLAPPGLEPAAARTQAEDSRASHTVQPGAPANSRNAAASEAAAKLLRSARAGIDNGGPREQLAKMKRMLDWPAEKAPWKMYHNPYFVTELSADKSALVHQALRQAIDTLEEEVESIEAEMRAQNKAERRKSAKSFSGDFWTGFGKETEEIHAQFAQAMARSDAEKAKQRELHRKYPFAMRCSVCNGESRYAKFVEGIGYECAHESCNGVTQQVTCPHCHRSNRWRGNYREGQKYACANCSKEFQHVSCPHCERSNFWKTCGFATSKSFVCAYEECRRIVTELAESEARRQASERTAEEQRQAEFARAAEAQRLKTAASPAPAGDSRAPHTVASATGALAPVADAPVEEGRSSLECSGVTHASTEVASSAAVYAPDSTAAVVEAEPLEPATSAEAESPEKPIAPGSAERYSIASAAGSDAESTDGEPTNSAEHRQLIAAIGSNAQFSDSNVRQLREECKRRLLPTGGRRAELMERITGFDAAAIKLKRKQSSADQDKVAKEQPAVEADAEECGVDPADRQTRSNVLEERRVDPTDGQERSLIELVHCCSASYSLPEICDYWETLATAADQDATAEEEPAAANAADEPTETAATQEGPGNEDTAEEVAAEAADENAEQAQEGPEGAAVEENCNEAVNEDGGELQFLGGLEAGTDDSSSETGAPALNGLTMRSPPELERDEGSQADSAYDDSESSMSCEPVPVSQNSDAIDEWSSYYKGDGWEDDGEASHSE